MNVSRLGLLACALLMASGAVYAFRATGQDLPQREPPRTEQRVQVPRTVTEIVNGKPVQRVVLEEQIVQIPAASADRWDGLSSSLMGGVDPGRQSVNADPEILNLYQEERAAADEAARLTAQIRKAGGDTEENREQLREKLATIFDLQQQRRAHEVAKIEARLANLKDIMKKRESAKDSIVDRRLQVLTGGVDELGWEETRLPGQPRADILTIPSPTILPPVPYNPEQVVPGRSSPGTIISPRSNRELTPAEADPFGTPSPNAPMPATGDPFGTP